MQCYDYQAGESNFLEDGDSFGGCGAAGDRKSGQSCERACKCRIWTVFRKDIKFSETKFPLLNSSIKECMFEMIGKKQEQCKTIQA